MNVNRTSGNAPALVAACLAIVFAIAVGQAGSLFAQDARDDLPANSGPPQSAREMFEQFGIDESLFYIFRQQEPWRDAENEPLSKVLFRLPQVKLLDVERWAKRGVAAQEMLERPADFQREFVQLAGRVRRVTVEQPIAELQDRYDMEKFYRCELVLERRGQRAIVFARAVPDAWQRDATIDEPASAYGVFLKAGSIEAASDEVKEQTALFFAANRVAWHPATPLGKLGMDYGLFDTVAQRRPITHDDQECFYQLLAAAGRANVNQLNSAPVGNAAALGRLLEKPEEQLGTLQSFRGTARRAIKIEVTDPEVVARLGFDHYYEVVVFVPVKTLLKPVERKVNSYPVVFCVRELPPHMPTGENIAETVEAAGFMFKLWRYSTELTAEVDPDLRLLSPLLVGRDVQWVQRTQSAELPIGSIVAAVVLSVVFIVGGITWYLGRDHRRIQRALLPERVEIPREPTEG